jgi:GNAT superfamily N-acetyltransferase
VTATASTPVPTPVPTAESTSVPTAHAPTAPWPPSRLPLIVRLEPGRVRVRPVHHGDGPRLQALLGRLSLRTRWLRFHSPIAQLTPAQLRSLVEVDHRDRETLLAEVELDGRWHLAGFAQYHRLRGASRGLADSAIVLEDTWQGRGIGRVLATCLAQMASLAGIDAFTGEVLSENRSALGFIRALVGSGLERRLHGPTVEVVCWLPPRHHAGGTGSAAAR